MLKKFNKNYKTTIINNFEEKRYKNGKYIITQKEQRYIIYLIYTGK